MPEILKKQDWETRKTVLEFMLASKDLKEVEFQKMKKEITISDFNGTPDHDKYSTPDMKENDEKVRLKPKRNPSMMIKANNILHP